VLKNKRKVVRVKKEKMVIMLCGHAGAGKTTVAQYIEEIWQDKAVRRIPIAESLKEIAKNMGWDGKKDEKGRRLLIELGTVGRHYDENLWIKQCVQKILEDNSHDIFLIDDWRFPNELYYTMRELQPRSYEVITVRIERIWRDPTAPPDDPSECSLDNIVTHYTIDNNGTMEVLKENVRLLCGALDERNSYYSI